MEQAEFLAQHIFTGLNNLNDGFDKDATRHYFSEADFAIVLDRVAHFGVGIFAITPCFEGKLLEPATHETFRKKATDAKWYKKAFQTFKHSKTGSLYSATYKVSAKLLAKEKVVGMAEAQAKKG